jgi:hypothetical protein
MSTHSTHEYPYPSHRPRRTEIHEWFGLDSSPYFPGEHEHTAYLEKTGDSPAIQQGFQCDPAP